MRVIIEWIKRIVKLEEKVPNIVQTARVSGINASNGLVNVTFDDDLEIEGIPFLTMRAGTDKTYWMPSVNEMGILLSPDGNISKSVFLPAMNYSVNPVPETDPNISKRIWSDGTEESYNKTGRVFSLTVGSSVIQITPSGITITGNTTITGNLSVSGTISSGGTTLDVP